MPGNDPGPRSFPVLFNSYTFLFGFLPLVLVVSFASGCS
jgi:hypothetical protein